MHKNSQPDTPMQGKLYRNPNNPFEAWDEEGRPCLPATIDDDAPSNGVTPGPFGIYNPDGSRAVPAARRPARLPSRSSASSRKLMVDYFDWS